MPGSDRTQLEDTLARASRGDEDAWRLIIDAYSPRVFGLLRAQCGDADLADELTQSTFCTIVAKLDSYTEVGRFEAWLFRIAMNRLRDEMRRRKRQASPVESDALVGLAGEAAGNRDDPAGTTSDLESLRSAIAKLSETEQKIIHLRHHGELSFKQLADVLDEPMGTILARHHRALKKLRDLLGPGTDPGADETSGEASN